MAQAIGLALMGINEVLKSQGITSDAQSYALDPFGTILDKTMTAGLPREQRELTEEEWAMINQRGLEREQREQADRDYRGIQSQKKLQQRAVQEALKNRGPAQSKKLNVAYQGAINRAIANPLAQTTTRPQRITRTTDQQVADRELQQKIQNLRSQLQPATTAKPTRALPPSVSIKGKGASKLLVRVMTEFNMGKEEAQKYIKRHGSN
jgi:hypothetical protein